jgi:hypothetical protein
VLVSALLLWVFELLYLPDSRSKVAALMSPNACLVTCAMAVPRSIPVAVRSWILYGWVGERRVSDEMGNQVIEVGVK